MENFPITIEDFNGVKVLRDDLLPGGTKACLMPTIIGEADEYVYATPVYGGFQIALAEYCKLHGKKATLVCAKRKVMHPNTKRCLDAGANIIEVKHGYLSVVEKHARFYINQNPGAVKLQFGGDTPENREVLTRRVKNVMQQLGGEPDEIWVAVGSGTLIESILAGTTTAVIHGVSVGRNYSTDSPRVVIHKYHRKFEFMSKYSAPFKSMPNYDLKAFEYCMSRKGKGSIFFWNVF